MTQWFGLTVMVVSEAATLLRIEPFSSWNTPIAWTGFILFADSVVFAARGDSWIRSAPREFFWLTLASIPLWLVFEFYNLYIENWYYTGLPEPPLLRLFGYGWAFATIWPAIFEGAELVAVWRERDDRRSTNAAGRRQLSGARRVIRASEPGRAAPFTVTAIVCMSVGAAMLIWPLLWPSRYLAAPVWLGFIFLLDPINRWLGAESLMNDFAAGRYDRMLNLAWSGLLCGVLWEFWNYWSRAKWHYTVPIMEQFKIFEMPLPGYLGFPAFAIECFTMYVFVRALVSAVTSRDPHAMGRPVGVWDPA